MPFEKGNKFGKGRPPGSPNKVSSQLRQSINDFLADNFKEIQRTWMNAGERERLTFYLGLLRFALPQLQSVEVQSDFERLTDSELQDLYNELLNAQKNSE